MAFSMPVRRSTADIIFAQLRDEIMSLELLPGAKLSEAEVAAKFGVSRQPVREALNRLSTEELVDIQPQRATRVRRFSSEKIAASRFVRRAIEIELVKKACERWQHVYQPAFQRCLEAQDRAVAGLDGQNYHTLDEEFHGLLAEAAEAPFAFAHIKSHKAFVDRLCVLSLKNADGIADLVQDHRNIFECVVQRDASGAEEAMRLHLSRIETTIESVRQANAEYFDD